MGAWAWAVEEFPLIINVLRGLAKKTKEGKVKQTVGSKVKSNEE